ARGHCGLFGLIPRCAMQRRSGHCGFRSAASARSADAPSAEARRRGVMEDPGYFGATVAFGNVDAQMIPVPLDEQGLCVAAGVRICSHAKGAYVTPAHQFPLGMTMSLERRMALLKWASHSGAFVIEDDYDSEYRFEGRPVPALQSLDRNSNVIFIG